MQEFVSLSFLPARIPENTVPLLTSECLVKMPCLCLAVLSCRNAGGHPITLQWLTGLYNSQLLPQAHEAGGRL